MPRGVALSKMRTRVRRACDIENATARFPDSEVNDYLNESLAELYDLIRNSFGQDYYRKRFVFQTFGNAERYPLPPDFLDLVSVDVPLGGNLVLTARPYMENERNLYKFFPFGAWTMNQPIWYRLTGAVDATANTPQTISFIPLPTGAYNIHIHYVPTPPILVNDTDTFDGVAGWEEYAILDAAMKCATKDESFDLLQALQGRKDRINARIEKMASEHDGGQADRVQDVTKTSDTWNW